MEAGRHREWLRRTGNCRGQGGYSDRPSLAVQREGMSTVVGYVMGNGGLVGDGADHVPGEVHGKGHPVSDLPSHPVRVAALGSRLCADQSPETLRMTFSYLSVA